MKVSIIIPVYNEEKTIAHILQHVSSVSLPNVIREIIVIDDGSTDGTQLKITKQIDGIKNNIRFIKHQKNYGKGAAVKTGIKYARGEYIIIQDADAEYDPSDISRLLQPILLGKAQIVYGTRLKRLPHFRNEEKSLQFLTHYIGNKFLSFIISILYVHWLTDMETGYKIFPRKAVMSLTLHAKGFDIEPEITAKFLKAGYKILEVPIITKPRSYAEGKKLQTCRDGIGALRAIITYRFKD